MGYFYCAGLVVFVVSEVCFLYLHSKPESEKENLHAEQQTNRNSTQRHKKRKKKTEKKTNAASS